MAKKAAPTTAWRTADDQKAVTYSGRGTSPKQSLKNPLSIFRKKKDSFR